MESLLWALDLLAVVYLCFWALREDNALRRAAARQKSVPRDGA